MHADLVWLYLYLLPLLNPVPLETREISRCEQVLNYRYKAVPCDCLRCMTLLQIAWSVSGETTTLHGSTVPRGGLVAPSMDVQ
jgi:hypothetical protein